MERIAIINHENHCLFIEDILQEDDKDPIDVSDLEAAFI